MEWKNSIYLDTYLPFGLRSAPKLFNVLAELLVWIFQRNGVTFSIHYLDDFPTMGPPHSPTCNQNLHIFTDVCARLRVPLAEGSPTVAKSCTLLLKSYLKSMKSLDFRNLKSRKLAWKLVKYRKFTVLVMLKIPVTLNSGK